MARSSSQPATRIEITGPQLHADRAGYVLDGRYIDGFADDLSLNFKGRRLLADWALAFGYELDDAQRALLEVPEPVDPVSRELLHAAVTDLEVDLPFADQFGLFDRLTEDELLLVDEPWRGLPGEERRDYPLNVTELATLTGTTAKQIREWETARLLPSSWIDGRRQFCSAAVVHAFALRRLSRFQIAALANIMTADSDDDVFIQLAQHTLAARRQRAAS
jgi:hypothetical protein